MTPIQRVPNVTEGDVDRIVRREYSTELAPMILATIKAVEVREKPRVILACLKVAEGNPDQLRHALSEAAGYSRELIAEAEYPHASRAWSRLASLPSEDVEAIFGRDWHQYSEWLARH